MFRTVKRSPSTKRTVVTDLPPHLLRLAGGLILVTGLVACGDDDDKKPSGGDTGTTDTAVDDTGGGDTTVDDTGGGDTTVDDTGTDTAVEDTGTEDTGTDTAVEDTGGEDSGSGADTTVDDTTVDDTSGSGDTTVDDTSGSGDTSGPTGLVVFGDDYGSGVAFAPFGGSTNAVSVDSSESASGSASLRVDVPSGGYTGGALVSSRTEALTSYNAVTFWAKASRDATLNVAGMGNDSADNYLQVEERGIALTTTWTKYTVPLVATDRLGAVAGLFHFAEGSDEGAYTIWMDEVTYETLDTIGATTAAFGSAALDLTPGQTARATGLVATVEVAGSPVTIYPSAPYFDWSSSNTGAATVDGSGLVTAVGGGSATITATLGGTAAGGTLTVNVVDGPATAAPAPTTPAGDVIASLYSDAYTAAAVDTFRTPWSAAAQSFDTVAGDNVLVYSALDFVGVEFTGANSVDATDAAFLHVDVWTPNATMFGVKLVDWGADNSYGGGDDSEAQLEFTPSTTPALTTGGWVSLDIPMSSFAAAGLLARAHLSQLIFVGRVDGAPGLASVYLDNVYLYGAGSPPPPSVPTSAAPIATTPEAAVVASIFSDAYAAWPVDTFRTPWSAAGQSVEVVAGDNTLLYSDLDFAGVEFTGANAIDATAATHIHFDLWTPNATEFGLKLVDWGADNGYGGGDDTEAQINFGATSSPALTTGSWVSYDVPLADFTAAGLNNRAHLSQMIVVGRADGATGVAEVYLDNVYLYEVVADTSLSVFGDDYGTGVGFSAFGGSTNNLTVDTSEFAEGRASLRVDVPAGGYTGGALATTLPADLSGYNALTFWAKADRSVTLNVAGIGNDASTAVYQIEARNLSVGTSWRQYTIPLLDASKLTAITGLFHFAEGSDEGAYTLWLDDVRYADVTTLGAPAGAFGTAALTLSLGGTGSALGLVATVAGDAGDITVFPTAAYFDWFSSDTGVATVSTTGTVTAVATGTASITATLGGVSAAGSLDITVTNGPDRAAPVPTVDSRGVVASVFSDAYTAWPVNTFRTDWSSAAFSLESIGGDGALLYSSLDFAGMEFTGANAIDASGASFIHFDVWTPNATEFALKLVDWGADNGYAGGDDTEAQLAFTASTTPALSTGGWVSFDIPLADFASAGLAARSHLSQLIISARVDGAPGTATVYLDNIFFY